MRRFTAGVIAGLLVGTGGMAAWIFSTPAAHGDIGPTGYTLEDIYQFIVTNGGTSPVEGGHALSPTSAPGQGGMHTMKDILAALKAKLPCHGELPATGQTKCYNVDGTVIDCASADFPGQDGFYRAGCPMAGRFTDNGDGTVTDSCTGLMWQKETAQGYYTWQDALKYCESLDLAGHTDWRLPNVRELQSIVDYGRTYPSIDPAFGAESDWYFSSSTFILYPDNALGVYFNLGEVVYGWKSYECNVRAVRSGT